MTHKQTVQFSSEISVNEKLFFFLLCYSLSLSPAEKARVLNSLPELSQTQVDALMNTFLDERRQFVHLLNRDKKELKIITGLLKKQQVEWRDVTAEYTIPKMYTERTWAKYFYEDKETRERLSFFQDPDFPFGTDTERLADGSRAKPFDELTLDDIKKTYQYPIELIKKAVQVADEYEQKKPKLTSLHMAIENLSEVVMGQDAALTKLATLCFFHKRFATVSELTMPEKQKNMRQMPILLLGSTGTGKTHMVKSIAKEYGLNFVMIDASTMVRTGIVGTSLDSIGKMIYEQSEKSSQKAEYSVVFFDEFDKLFMQTEHGYGIEIATQLLTVIEGSAPFPIEQPPQHLRRDDGSYPSHIDSSKMLFILAGSFGVHEKIFNKKQLGFHKDKEKTTLAQINQLKLSELGLPDELAGRIGQIICLQPLDEQAFVEILCESPTSPFTVLKNQLSMMNCEVKLPDKVVRTLIRQNQQEIQKFGARGLYQAFNTLPCIAEILLQATVEEGQKFIITLP